MNCSINNVGMEFLRISYHAVSEFEVLVVSAWLSTPFSLELLSLISIFLLRISDKDFESRMNATSTDNTDSFRNFQECNFIFILYTYR